MHLKLPLLSFACPESLTRWHGFCFTLKDSLFTLVSAMHSPSLQQSLSQQQTLAPQMRQSLEILQSTTLELGQLLSQSLETNPVLESENLAESLEEIQELESSELEGLHDFYDEELRELNITERRNQPAPSEETREHFINSLVSPLTLQEHLRQQINLTGLSSSILFACEVVIGNLDQNGFLDAPLHQLVAQCEFSLDDLEEALGVIQLLDPPGIGAKDLRDSLLLQLERKQMIGTLEYKITESHLPELARKHYPQIAKTLKTNIQKITEAAEFISHLDPSPGSSYDPTRNPYISVDIYIKKDPQSGEWFTETNQSHLPRLKISETYKEIVGSSSSDKKTRQYLNHHIREGRILIKAISQRQETITAITQSIITHQRDFLEKGIKHLKPLTMNTVAEEVNVHPTTVSRAVAGKYVETPHGIIEMRKFFSSGYLNKDGAEISNNSVREAIQALIQDENKMKPLADSAITKILEEKGLQVARRTVAKYREQLGILPSNLRKSFQ